jgi:uncharacterized membrane protein YhaH (DUF805 family)
MPAACCAASVLQSILDFTVRVKKQSFGAMQPNVLTPVGVCCRMTLFVKVFVSAVISVLFNSVWATNHCASPYLRRLRDRGKSGWSDGA